MRARALATWATAVLSTLVVLLGTASAPAVAESSGYRYWSFWTQSDQDEWRYASQGPTALRPSDGKVVGFRFTVSESAQGASDGNKPRGQADFTKICSDTEPEPDRKRVAVVIDPGTENDAPADETPPRPKTVCAQLEKDGSAADALAQTAPPLRYDSSGLLCAIAGYPNSGCGERTSNDNGGPSGEREQGGDADDTAGGDSDGSATIPLVAGLTVVALLAAGAVWQTRRRRDS